MDLFKNTRLNPKAMPFFPSKVLQSSLDPHAEVYYPKYLGVTTLRGKLNPNAEVFLPPKRLNPNAKVFKPSRSTGVEKKAVVKFGQKGTEKCAADEPWKGTGKPNPMSQSKDQEELMTQLDVESCDSNYWQFWRHRFTEHKKLPIEGLEYYKFYL